MSPGDRAQGLFRVWPDGTVQDLEDRPSDPPYPWLSDDYATVKADSEDDARDKVLGPGWRK